MSSAGSKPHPDTGLWIATYRLWQGLTRQQLAERSHVSYALLTRIEAAVELPSLETVTACAAALEVETRELAGPYRQVLPAGPALKAKAEAERDVLALPAGEGVRPRPLGELADEVRKIGGHVRTGRYGVVTTALPQLLTDLRVAVLAGDDQQAAQRLLTEAYRYGALTTMATLPGTVVATYRAPTGTYSQPAVLERFSAPTPDPYGGLLVNWVVPLVCVGLGVLLGFGIAELYYTGNLPLQILGGFIGITVLELSRLMMSSYHRNDLGYAIAWFGYLGGQTSIVIFMLSVALGSPHPVLWIIGAGAWVYAKLMKSLLGLRDRRALVARWSYLAISMTLTLLALHRPWWAYLVCAALVLADIYVFALHPPHGEVPEGFDDVFPLDPPH